MSNVPTFAAWMHDLDNRLWTLAQVQTSDLPDSLDLRELYEDGYTARRVALLLLEAEGFVSLSPLVH